MSGFDVTPVELQVCGSLLAHISDEVRTEMRVLQAEMDSVLGDGWQGRAAQGFAQGWQRWQTGAHDVLDALDTMGRLQGTTGRDYDSTDVSSASMAAVRGEPVTGRFRVRPARLLDIIEQISRFERHLESALEDADVRVNHLHATLTGAAADEHQAAHERWKRGAREMRDALRVMRSIASTAHDNYTSAAETNARMWEQAR